MSDLTSVWVLFGVTGEYSDRSEWAVRAYTSQVDAEADCEAMNAIAKDIRDNIEGYSAREEAVAERLTPHDTNASMDYTRTSYSIGEVPVVSVRQTSTRGDKTDG